MKPASPALIALLNTGIQFTMADLYTFTLAGGSVLRYSSAPTALVANGFSFALGPKFERSKTKTVIGTQVDELDIKIYPETTDLIGTTPWLQAAWQGQLDGALLQLERAFMPTYRDTSPGTVILFAGRISDIDCSRTGIDMKCRSHLELLNIQMPRRLWQTSCTHVFGDAMCQFDRASLQASFACLAGSTETQIVSTVNPTPQGLYAQGTVTALSGANAGDSRTIARHEQWHGDGKARIPVASGDRRPVPAAARLRPHNRDLHQRLQQRGPFRWVSVRPDPGNRGMTDPRRAAVLVEAASWLRTPYHHMGRVKGGGTDCLMLLAEVYEAAGVIPHVDIPFYPPDWHLHRGAERYLDGLMRYAREISEPAKRRRCGAVQIRPLLCAWGDRCCLAAADPRLAQCRRRLCRCRPRTARPPRRPVFLPFF